MTESDKDREIRKLHSQLAALEAAPAAPPAAAAIGKKVDRKGWLIVALVGVLALISYCVKQGGGGGGGSGGGGGERQASASAYSTAAAWAPPAGYDVYTSKRGGSVGIEWADPTDAECRGGPAACWAANVVTENDCPRGLYASITLLNPTGHNIGWTNDTAQGVRAGERTRLVFRTHERGVDAARIAEVNCHR